MAPNIPGGETPPQRGRSPSPLLSPGVNHAVYDSSFDVEMRSVSRPGSPPISEGIPEREVESVTCQWAGCGKPFNQLQPLIDHMHNDHIGVNKSNYTCEWETCSRRGMQQASRFALVSHIRAHTGEKPFTCQLPECDKSFTRSDAMAKHMRLQHNISPPLPGRGGNRKRKRDEDNEARTTPNPSVPRGDVHAASDLNSLTAWQDLEDNIILGPSPSLEERAEYFRGANAGKATSPLPNSSGSEDEDLEETLPEYLKNERDPETGKIHGRSPAMVQYLIMKAKHNYALEQHVHLLEELRVARGEERRAREQKEEVLDEVFRTLLGPQAEKLIQEPQLPYPNVYGSTPFQAHSLNGNGPL